MSVAAKVCIRCKQDCSNRPRVKDPQGRYTCRVCLDAAKPLARPAPPDDGAIPIADEPLPASLLDAPAAPVAAGLAMCPSCGSSIPHGGAICVQCGFDVRKGQKLGTAEGPLKEESPIPPKGGKCGKCGYSLKGLKQPRCPECGTVVGKLTDRERRRRENAETVKWSYLKPLIHIAVGLGGGVLFYLATAGSIDVVKYLITYAIQLPFCEAVFVACCFMWIGFDSSLHLILLRIAGVLALVSLAAVFVGYVPFGIAKVVLIVLIYIGLMSESMELDFQDAVLVGIATYGVQLIIGLMLIAWLVAHL